VRIALGGVAHKPWRALDAERRLFGNPLATEAIVAAGAAAVAGARPLAGNAFKVKLAERAVVQALRTAGGLA